MKKSVNEKLSAAVVDFEFWGCKKLLESARTPAKKILKLKVSNTLNTNDGSLVCLVALSDYANFLTNENKTLRGFLFEPNVRAYQGEKNPVNTDIRKTLETVDSTEFWWLNNGITILATNCPMSGNIIEVETPEIVNGLQTSQEIFDYFSNHEGKIDNRNLLIRIIKQTDESVRNKIIKATNFQTDVPPLSLFATEPIHFDIEDRLKLYGLYYDRRKGYYRILRKPIADIVSMLDVVRAVIAIYLQRPDDARARPQSLTNKETTRKQIFGENYNKDLYPACLLLDRQMDSFLKEKTSLSIFERGDLRFYLDWLVACELTENAKPSVEEIASLVPSLVVPIPDSMVQPIFEKVNAEYRKLLNEYAEKNENVTRVAKGTDLKARLLAYVQERFPNKGKAKLFDYEKES